MFNSRCQATLGVVALHVTMLSASCAIAKASSPLVAADCAAPGSAGRAGLSPVAGPSSDGPHSQPAAVLTAARADRCKLRLASASPPEAQLRSAPNSLSGSPIASGERPVPTNSLYQIPGEDPGYLINLAPTAGRATRALAANGVYLHVFLQQNNYSTVSGGNKPGVQDTGLTFPGLDIDTGQAFGLPGGLIDLTFSSQFGNNGSPYNGPGSNSFVPWLFHDGAGLADLYYNQNIAAGVVQVTVGRLNQLTALPYTSPKLVSPGFHVMPFYCVFATTACGASIAFNSDSNKPGYRIGTWGGLVTLHPRDHWYVKAGVIENEPVESTEIGSNEGWPGRDWGINQADGAFLPAQIGYITSPQDVAYPTYFHLGGFFDTADYADKYYNAAYRSSVRFPGKPLMDNRAAGIFAGLQRTIVRFNPNPKSLRGIAVFATGDWDVEGLQQDQQQYLAGFSVTGPLAFRSADTLNVLFDYQVFDPREKAVREAVAAAHGLSYVMRAESGVELNYALAVAPGVAVSPFTQYIVNPDQLGLAVPKPGNRYAVVVGFRSVFVFGRLLGLPVVPS